MLKDIILKYIYPNRCSVCGNIMTFGSKGYVCQRCAKENFDMFGKVYNENNIKFQNDSYKIYFSGGISLFPYVKARKAIHILKYYGGRINVKNYAELLFDYLEIYGGIDLNDIDIVTFVPMYPDKERMRGYNQAKLVAEEFAKLAKKPCMTALRKLVFSESQSRLTSSLRLQNVKNTYSAEHNADIKGKRILIVDDVFTTGATINECSKVLHESGAERIYFATIAYASDLNVDKLKNM